MVTPGAGRPPSPSDATALLVKQKRVLIFTFCSVMVPYNLTISNVLSVDVARVYKIFQSKKIGKYEYNILAVTCKLLSIDSNNAVF